MVHWAIEAWARGMGNKALVMGNGTLEKGRIGLLEKENSSNLFQYIYIYIINKKRFQYLLVILILGDRDELGKVV